METVRDPRETDQLLAAWLAREIGLTLNEQPATGTMHAKLVAVSTRSTPNLNKAKLRLGELLTPATEKEITDALISLEQATGKPKDDGEDAQEMKLDRYAAKLADYPADIVLHTLSKWDDSHEFFPRWKELRVALDATFLWRRRVLPALQAFSVDAPKEETRTPEEIEADKQFVRRRLLEYCKGTGNRPRRDLLPDDVQLDEVETRASPRPERTAEPGALLASRIERITARERDEIERELHPEQDYER